MDDKQDELYIPSNIKTRLEFFKGYGVKEMVITLIVMAFSLPIAFGIYKLKSIITAIIFLFILVAGTVVAITKGEIKFVINKEKIQKINECYFENRDEILKDKMIMN